MNYTYLLIDLALLLLSVLLFSTRKSNFSLNSKFIILSVLITTFVFSIPTEKLTLLKIIVFNPPYLTGGLLWDLPVEELLFSSVMPLLGLAIYLFLNTRYPSQALEKYSLAFSNMMMGVCVAMLYFGYHNIYTLITFALLLVFIIYVEFLNKVRFMYRFYRAYLLSLVPFYICSFILASLPVIQYNDSETLIFRVFNVPFENQFYFMGMLLLTVYLFEVFKSKAITNGGLA